MINTQVFLAGAGRLSLSGLLLAIGLSVALPAKAEIQRNFDPVYSSNQRGNLMMTGNTLMTCTASTNCANTQAGGSLGNQDFNMDFVNIDPGAGLSNSSMATLALPPGATVTWAGLYWQGRHATVTPAGIDSLYLRTPGAADYSLVSATQIDTMDAVPAMPGSDPRPAYLAYAEVTEAVAAAGGGDYYAGGLEAETGRDGHGFFGGWALIVAYQQASEPLRHLVVYNGAAGVGKGLSPVIDIPVTGLLTPVTGSFDAQVGAIIAEGDMRVEADSLRVNGTNLSNGVNPASNFGNSTISNPAGLISAKNPNYTNQLGVDYDVLEVPYTLLGNGANSATLTFASFGTDYQYLQSVFFVTDLYLPELVVEKTATDIDGGELLLGDTVEYRITATNVGLDAALDAVLVDPLPAGTTYVADSLVMVENAGGATGPQTAVGGDDVAEIAANVLSAYLGTGAVAGSGGRMAPSSSVELLFRVVVDDPALMGQNLVNNAELAMTAETTGDVMPLVNAEAVLPVYLPPDPDPFAGNAGNGATAVPALPVWAIVLLNFGLVGLSARVLRWRGLE